MQEKLDILNGLELGEFIQISETDYKSEIGDAVILLHADVEEFIKERLKEEIPYISNERLKKYLPEKFQSDIILDDYKELSKYDSSMLFNSIIDPDLFFVELISPPDEIEIAELILSNSQWVYGDDKYVIFYAAVETETN